MHINTKFAVATLTAVAFIGVSATAYAADSSDSLNGQATPATVAAPAKTGPAAPVGAKRWAVVEDNGVLARGKNTISSNQVSGGSYEVFFDRDVTKCAYVATIGTTSTGTEPAGSITVASRAGQPTGVWVDTTNLDGTDGVRSFHLQVIC